MIKDLNEGKMSCRILLILNYIGVQKQQQKS